MSVNKAMLVKLYISESKSIPDVAKALGMNYSATRTLLISEGVAIRSRADGVRAARHKIGINSIGKKREFTEQWKKNLTNSLRASADIKAKGVSTKKSGRVQITRGENKHRMLHSVLMEQQIGRRLDRNEVVHHIDENPNNNSIENLQLMTRAEHTSHHRKQLKRK